MAEVVAEEREDEDGDCGAADYAADNGAGEAGAGGEGGFVHERFVGLWCGAGAPGRCGYEGGFEDGGGEVELWGRWVLGYH